MNVKDGEAKYTAEYLHEHEVINDSEALPPVDLLKTELLATVSHELRSPLATIKGYAATLLRHDRHIAREERHEFLLAIHQASGHLATMIDRLLEMSQLETGTITLERAPIDVPHLVNEAIYAAEQRLLAYQADTLRAQKHCTFNVRLEDDNGRATSDEPLIEGDRRFLREMLDNLLENAVIYSPDGGVVEVVIRPIVPSFQPGGTSTEENSGRSPRSTAVSTISGRQRMMEISVQDNGKGIPPEHLESIFEHFHRVDTRLTREVGGLGLGLAICERIVALHDGIIWVESIVGKGSTFHVRLPM